MSSRRMRILLISITLITFLLAAGAAGTPKIDPQDMKNIMLVKDVKPGMKGYGKTVFRGTEPETFQVEILGVLDKANLGTELILVKLAGGPITERDANLIEGMSGSPIYINGKVLGAFAYGGVFGKEPIGMVTPIQYMLEAWDSELPSEPSSFYPFSTMSLDEPIMLGGSTFSKVSISGGTAGQEALDPGTLVFRPLAMPIMVSGVSPRIIERMQTGLNRWNVRLVAGPGLPADKADMDVDLKAGSACGATLVTGDVDMTGVGTVTYRRGDKLVAFGHPMMGLGAIDAALTTAYVFDVFPSYMVSSKLAAPLKTVGTVYQDRPWCIAAEIGRMPDMVPVTVHVDNAATGRSRDFNAKVIRHPMLSKMFIPMIAAEAISETTGAPTDSTAKVRFSLEAEEVGTITRENVFSDATSIESASVGELQQLMTLLQYNPFRPVGIERLEMWVDIVPKHQTARLERIFLKEGKFKPGDTIEIGAVIKPFKGERVRTTIDLPLPKDMPAGRMSLRVTGGATPQGSMMPDDEMMMMAGPSMGGPSQAMPSIENVQQLVKKFLERDKNNELVAKIVLPKPVPSISGEKLSGLPPTIATAMKSSKSTMLGSEPDEVKEVQPTDWVVIGAQRLTITIEKDDKTEKKSGRSGSSSSVSTPSAPDGSDEDNGMPDDYEDMILTPGGGLMGDRLVQLAAEPEVAAPAVTPDPADEESEAEAEDTEVDSDSGTPSKSTPSSTIEKPVGRGPSVWKQTSSAEFAQGSLIRTAATTDDLVMLAGALEPLYESTETYVWCMTRDVEGNVYAGTGNHGMVYKIAKDGKTSVLYDSPELEIHSLAAGQDSVIYAGTSPNGIVYRITADGKAEVLLDAEEKYITALALDSKGNVYAATGDKCKVYRISPDGNAETVLKSSEFHALSLAVDKDDNVYVGTALNGIVYKIAADGKASVIYDAAEDSVSSLAVDANGVVYAGTSPKGVIYKIAPDATPKALYDKAGQGISGISLDSKGNVYAINSTSVYKIMPDETVCTLCNDRDLQFLSLVLDDGHLYAGTGNIGSIYRANIGATVQGTLESPVHDCGLTSEFGVISWNADLPEGSSVVLQTRTGFVAEPDATWSGWSSAYGTPAVKISSPPGRYIQYRAILKAADAAKSPKLKDVSVVYLAQNQAPKVKLTSPTGGEKWSKKRTIKWSGSDPDKDTLTYELSYSTDGGKTWKPLAVKVKSATPSTTEDSSDDDNGGDPSSDEPITIESADPEQMVAEMAAELDKHPEIPQEIKDKLLAEAPAMIAAENEAAESEAGSEAESPATEEASAPNGNNSTKQTSYSWDTSKFKDGSYLIKVVASDRLSNPTGELSEEVVSEPITLVNKAPRVAAFKRTLTVQKDKSVRIEGLAYQDLAAIAGVQYKIGSDEWAAAAASDGIYDTPFEGFVITTLPLDKGRHTLEIKAIDEAGNGVTTKMPVEVE